MKKIGIAIFLGLIASVTVYHFYTKTHTPLNVTLYGNVDIRDVNVGFRVSGRLLSLKVDEGDKVQTGQLLGQLDPDPYLREVNSAKALVAQQEAALSYAQTVFAREKKLFGTGASSVDRYQNAQASLDQAKAGLDRAKADLSLATLRLQDTNLYSPSDGVILTRAVEPGTMLNVNNPVLTISLTNPVWVRAYISEPQLSKAKQGTKVSVYSDSHPDKAYEGVIGFVSPLAEFTPKTVETSDLRTELVYRLRIVVQDPNQELRQGMPVTVVLN